MKKKILVIGGTGMLGKPVAKQLKDDGFEVIVFTRNPEEARIKMPTSFSYAKGNVNDEDSVAEAMTGVYGVHINLQGGPSTKSFEQIEHTGTKNIIRAARKKGIKKVTYISGTSVNEKNSWFPATRAKLMAEEVIRSSGINYTIFRPSWFYESIPMFVQDNKATIIGNNKNKYHWLAARDYATIVSTFYLDNNNISKTLTIYGPETYTIEEAIDKYCEVNQQRIKKTRVSAGTLKFIGTITFNPKLKFIGRFMKYFEGVSENFENSSDNIYGTPTTLISDWASEK